MWGLFGTGLTGAALCLVAAGFALVISSRTAESTLETPVLFPAKSMPWRMLIVSAGTGLTLLALEVVWFRFLRLYVSSSSIAFCVMLANVANAQAIQVTLYGVNGSTNFVVPMSILVGETNGNGRVNASDVVQTKSRVGQQINATNFRSDVNANGYIDAADVALVKSYIGTGFP